MLKIIHFFTLLLFHMVFQINSAKFLILPITSKSSLSLFKERFSNQFHFHKFSFKVQRQTTKLLSFQDTNTNSYLMILNKITHHHFKVTLFYLPFSTCQENHFQTFNNCHYLNWEKEHNGTEILFLWHHIYICRWSINRGLALLIRII